MLSKVLKFILCLSLLHTNIITALAEPTDKDQVPTKAVSVYQRLSEAQLFDVEDGIASKLDAIVSKYGLNFEKAERTIIADPLLSNSLAYVYQSLFPYVSAPKKWTTRGAALFITGASTWALQDIFEADPATGHYFQIFTLPKAYGVGISAMAMMFIPELMATHGHLKGFKFRSEEAKVSIKGRVWGLKGAVSFLLAIGALGLTGKVVKLLYGSTVGSIVNGHVGGTWPEFIITGTCLAFTQFFKSYNNFANGRDWIWDKASQGPKQIKELRQGLHADFANAYRKVRVMDPDSLARLATDIGEISSELRKIELKLTKSGMPESQWKKELQQEQMKAALLMMSIFYDLDIKGEYKLGTEKYPDGMPKKYRAAQVTGAVAGLAAVYGFFLASKYALSSALEAFGIPKETTNTLTDGVGGALGGVTTLLAMKAGFKVGGTIYSKLTRFDPNTRQNALEPYTGNLPIVRGVLAVVTPIVSTYLSFPLMGLAAHQMAFMGWEGPGVTALMAITEIGYGLTQEKEYGQGAQEFVYHTSKIRKAGPKFKDVEGQLRDSVGNALIKISSIITRLPDPLVLAWHKALNEMRSAKGKIHEIPDAFAQPQATTAEGDIEMRPLRSAPQQVAEDIGAGVSEVDGMPGQDIGKVAASAPISLPSGAQQPVRAPKEGSDSSGGSTESSPAKSPVPGLTPDSSQGSPDSTVDAVPVEIIDRGDSARTPSPSEGTPPKSPSPSPDHSASLPEVSLTVAADARQFLIDQGVVFDDRELDERDRVVTQTTPEELPRKERVKQWFKTAPGRVRSWWRGQMQPAPASVVKWWYDKAASEDASSTVRHRARRETARMDAAVVNDLRAPLLDDTY